MTEKKRNIATNFVRLGVSSSPDDRKIFRVFNLAKRMRIYIFMGICVRCSFGVAGRSTAIQFRFVLSNFRIDKFRHIIPIHDLCCFYGISRKFMADKGKLQTFIVRAIKISVHP
jgi:hypothetical protein